MEESLVSVIIPVYNREDTIERAIDSVLCQTYSNIELIIVDDGSTDKSIERVHSYHDARIRLICQNEHGGANRARNAGIKDARGEYIAFQDSDDEWLPDKLKIQIDYMRVHQAEACYCALYNYTGKEAKTIPPDYENKEKYETNLKEVLRERNCVGTPTLVLHKSVFEKMGKNGFDETMPRYQDYDFIIRLVQCVDVAYVAQPLVHPYKSPNSISKNNDFQLQAVSMLLKKHRGFLHAKALFDMTLNNRTYHQDSAEVLKDLNSVQQHIPRDILDCKDELITYMLSQIRRPRQLLAKQYKNVMEHVEDRAFAIYGAGKIARKIYGELLERNVRPSCFLVTEKGSEDCIDQIPVYALDEYDNKQQMIIVGVDEKLQGELTDNLFNRGFMVYCVYQPET